MTQLQKIRDVFERLAAVDRMSSYDQRRMLHLIELLRVAPDALRERTQEKLSALLAREPESLSRFFTSIDRIVASAEREFENACRVAERVDGAKHADDDELNHIRKLSSGRQHEYG